MTTPAPAVSGPTRLASVDAFRGFVMILMMAEVMQLPAVAAKFPDNPAWSAVKYHTSHVAWAGCSLHDLIQPGFSFLVGVAVPFSLAARSARGDGWGWLALHTLWRSAVLVLLGVFFRSMHGPRTNWTFDDTLSQIGLGFPLLVLLGFATRRVQYLALLLVLVCYWAYFALTPIPEGFDYARVGVTNPSAQLFDGFAAHWNMNSNAAWRFDAWFLNLFPRPKPFEFHPGGYATLNFIPTLGTMILGLLADGWLKGGGTHRAQLAQLVFAGLTCLALGCAAHWSGVCPVVKRVWTPSWVLASGGACFLMLAVFYAAIEASASGGWAYPLTVVGRNSIVAYTLAHGFDDFVMKALVRHFGEGPFQVWGAELQPVVLGAAALALLWLILLWMDRRRVYVKI